MIKNNILLSQDLSVSEEYLKEILEELKKNFNKVYILDNELDNQNKNISYKIFREFTNKMSNKNFFKRLFFNYRLNLINGVLEKYRKIDYFFVIGNTEFSIYFLKNLKEINPNIKFILFLWDKLEYSHWKSKTEYFDYIFSYDRVDAQKNNFMFRPTFFINKCLENIPQEKEYALSYVGALRDRKRYEYIKYLKEYLIENGLKVFFKLYVDKNMKKNLPENYDKDLIITERISYLENLEILKKSKVVLDIKYKEQNGLTLRTYEALAAEIKLITDNEDIRNYDFYNEDNIKVINNINDIEKISLDFFKTTAERIDGKIKERYTVKGFLNEIFNKII